MVVLAGQLKRGVFGCCCTVLATALTAAATRTHEDRLSQDVQTAKTRRAPGDARAAEPLAGDTAAVQSKPHYGNVSTLGRWFVVLKN